LDGQRLNSIPPSPFGEQGYNKKYTAYFLFADLIGIYTHWTYMHIFRHIFLSNYWWQRSDIWLQASYKYPILWEVFLNPWSRNLTGPKTFPTIWHTYTKLVTKYQIPVINSCLEVRKMRRKMCIYKCTCMLNVYKNQQIGKQEVGIRGKRFWTHQITTSCFPTLLIFIHIEHICSFFVGFFSATIDGRNLKFGHKLHIGTSYRGKRLFFGGN
jgi:hypothetical protein